MTRTRMLLAVIAIAGLALVGVVPAAAAPTPVGQAAVERGMPDLPTPTVHGKSVRGGWYGPYHLRNYGSGKCAEIGNEATWDGAPATQYTCMAPWTQQEWWVWETHAEGSLTIQYLYNAHSGKCLETWSGHQVGAQLVQGVCHWDESELWLKSGGVFSGFWSYRNEFSGLCMSVWASSHSNGAALVQNTCGNTANQLWVPEYY